MRKLIVLALALLTIVGSTAATAATRQVSLARSGFLPASVTITVGDSITSTNQDSVRRSIVADNGTLSSGLIDAGGTCSGTFTQAVTFCYRAGRRTNVRGTVVVRAV